MRISYWSSACCSSHLLAASNPGLAQVLSFSTIGISFLFRPLGAVVAGYLGDRLGRKKMLVLTLVLMGASTSLIGVLPTYAVAGFAAPMLLILLRILQGFSAGGEWGGAALMSVEHAPVGRRGFFGRSEEHTSELQSLMRISYAGFCLK